MTFLATWGCASDFFNVFLWAQKLLIIYFGNFNMTFLATWGCASDFFREDTKIQNGLQKSTLIFFVGANFTNTFPMIWRCPGDFFKVSLKFKMAADQF